MRGWAADLLSDPRTWVLGAILLVLAVAAARPLARRAGWPVWPTAGLLISVAVVASITLSPAPGQQVGGPSLGAVTDCLRALPDPLAWLRALVATHNRGERVGNVLMFMPIGGFAVLATRRPVWAGLLAGLSPLLIEIGQALVGGGRDCAADDWVNNATGAVLGAVLATLLLRLSAWYASDPPAGR